MHVVATAGHVDHGKSTLVRALTGADPDRLEEERRRGLSIQLGYAWTALPEVGDVAFVDVPGHERFVATMLAGVGPVPAALLVVAADDPWMPQATEHLAALDAFDVRHAVVAVTRSDLADPAPAIARARTAVERTSMRGAPVVAVSGRTGAGLAQLRDRLVAMLTGLPEPDPTADVRLWVDRRFTISGTGTVVTGTLPAGTIRRGDPLALGSGGVRVRGVQALGRPGEAVSGVARVALNLTGELGGLDAHSVLTTPGAYLSTEVVDVRLTRGAADLPAQPMLHVGAVATRARVRPLGDEHVRLTLDRGLPLRVGDRALLRDPGSRRTWGLVVLDPQPPPLRRRGAAAQRARDLDAASGRPDLAGELSRRGLVHADTLRRIGVPVGPLPAGAAAAGGWLLSAARVDRARAALRELVEVHDAAHPLDRGVPPAVLAERLDLPTPDLVGALLTEPLHLSGGRVRATPEDRLPSAVEEALAALHRDLDADPFAAPTADRLRELGLDARSIAAAARTGRVLRLDSTIVLRPGADAEAVRRLAELDQPFTASQARSCLGTTRRVVLPLLAHLDQTGRTRRLADDRRLVVEPQPPPTGPSAVGRST